MIIFNSYLKAFNLKNSLILISYIKQEKLTLLCIYKDMKRKDQQRHLLWSRHMSTAPHKADEQITFTTATAKDTNTYQCRHTEYIIVTFRNQHKWPFWKAKIWFTEQLSFKKKIHHIGSPVTPFKFFCPIGEEKQEQKLGVKFSLKHYYDWSVKKTPNMLVHGCVLTIKSVITTSNTIFTSPVSLLHCCLFRWSEGVPQVVYMWLLTVLHVNYLMLQWITLSLWMDVCREEQIRFQS